MAKSMSKAAQAKKSTNQSVVIKLKQDINIAEVAAVIASSLGDVRNTFDSSDGWTLCDIGGVFAPSCCEMQTILESGSGASAIGINGNAEFEEGGELDIDSPVYRLYYEILRRQTNIQFFSLMIEGSGIFELSVFAQNDIQESCVYRAVVNLDGNTTAIQTEPIEVNTLIPNGSLVVKMKCVSETGSVDTMRWKGHIPSDMANVGERIVAIRTFGNRASVAASLKAIVARLTAVNPSVLARTLFVIYDATGDKTGGITSNFIGNARIIEMRGPNYGGGGNASALISMILRAGQTSDHEISEVILFDDDAHIDAETIIRHDAFITARKPGIVSTAVIYSRQRPSVIQEFGGIWGKFFSHDNHRVAVTQNDAPRLFFPYLVRSTRDISETYHARYIGKYQDVEFSTFIFISFPFACLEKAGAPLPIFLRNDDAEICLRMLKAGYKVVVNPNLLAWHDSAHNPIGEFYATLHGLIVNSRYGGISRSYFFRTFMGRISNLAGVGNVVLLTAYEKALDLYAAGPQWMTSDSIYETYGAVRGEIGRVLSNEASQVPFEVVDVLKKEKRVEVRNIVDPMPTPPTAQDIVFVDTKDDAYYSFKHSSASERVTALVEKCLHSLDQISRNFDVLTEQWSQYVEHFDHCTFWDELLGKGGIRLVGERVFDGSEVGEPTDLASVRLFRQERIRKISVDFESEYRTTPSIKIEPPSENQLPKGFDPEKYKRLNPDVATSGIDPAFHWLQFGRHENRQY